jgi:hypothetical protein
MAAGIIAIGLAVSSAYAEEAQTTPPEGSQMGSGMQHRGMMGMPGSMMGRSDQNGSAENSMPNMMSMSNMMNMMNTMNTMGVMMQMNQMMAQMNQMMEHCNRMMSSHMQAPNSQSSKPEQPPKG